jgi:hypothetical protein
MFPSLIQTDAIVESKVSGEPIKSSTFCNSIVISDVILSSAEGLMLAHLLGRTEDGIVDINLLSKIRKGDYLHASFA